MLIGVFVAKADIIEMIVFAIGEPLPACLPACLPARLPAFPPACPPGPACCRRSGSSVAGGVVPCCASSQHDRLAGMLPAHRPATTLPCSPLLSAAGIIVGTVPEGLLVTLIVSLSLSAKNMYAKNVLVKVGDGQGGCWSRWVLVRVGDGHRHEAQSRAAEEIRTGP